MEQTITEFVTMRGYPISPALVALVAQARNWPQPMQDQLIPLLESNGFKTEEQQAANMKKATLRAAARHEMLTGNERRRFAQQYDLPNAVRAVWWLRRRTAKTKYDG
jgi:hypothetical protein